MLELISRWIIIPGLLMFLISGCNDEAPVVQNNNEPITNMRVVLTPDQNNPPAVFSFEDLDFAGGQDPNVIADNLRTEVSYSGEITLFNNAVVPPETVHEEIAFEGTSHQFFFTGSAIDNALISIAYDDSDNSGNPIGLQLVLNSGNTPGTGNLQITLRHNLDKNAPGVSNGDITNAGGSNDLVANFQIVVE